MFEPVSEDCELMLKCLSGAGVRLTLSALVSQFNFLFMVQLPCANLLYFHFCTLTCCFLSLAEQEAVSLWANGRV